jgi:hypothetical protein
MTAGKQYAPDPERPTLDVEPEFVIKARDAFAVNRIEAGIEILIANGLREQASEERKAADEMRAWQQRHPEKVHDPDHEHVPAALRRKDRWQAIDAHTGGPVTRETLGLPPEA